MTRSKTAAATCPRPREFRARCIDGPLKVTVESASDRDPVGSAQIFWLRLKGARVDAAVFFETLENAITLRDQLDRKIAAAREAKRLMDEEAAAEEPAA